MEYSLSIWIQTKKMRRMFRLAMRNTLTNMNHHTMCRVCKEKPRRTTVVDNLTASRSLVCSGPRGLSQNLGRRNQMKTTLAGGVIGVVVLLYAAPLFGHHSFAAEFDDKKPIVI